MGWHGWTRRRVLRALVPVLAAAGVIAPAGPASAATTIDASIGVNGYADPQGQAVVSIRVTADELIDGEIQISRRDSGVVVRQGIQVPAGTTKDVLLVVPGPFFDGTMKVDVLDGDRAVATQNVRVRSGNDVELVGVLPRLLARSDELPDQATLDSGTGRAELAALPLDVVDLGPSALSSYDTIAGTSDDLAAIDQQQRQTLLLWVNNGGRLLLDDATAIDALPAAWRPGPAGYAWAGVGEVRVVGRGRVTRRVERDRRAIGGARRGVPLDGAVRRPAAGPRPSGRAAAAEPDADRRDAGRLRLRHRPGRVPRAAAGAAPHAGVDRHPARRRPHRRWRRRRRWQVPQRRQPGDVVVRRPLAGRRDGR